MTWKQSNTLNQKDIEMPLLKWKITYDKEIIKQIEEMIPWFKDNIEQVKQLTIDATLVLLAIPDEINNLVAKKYFNRFWNQFNGRQASLANIDEDALYRLQYIASTFLNMVINNNILSENFYLTLKHTLHYFDFDEDIQKRFISPLLTILNYNSKDESISNISCNSSIKTYYFNRACYFRTTWEKCDVRTLKKSYDPDTYTHQYLCAHTDKGFFLYGKAGIMYSKNGLSWDCDYPYESECSDQANVQVITCNNCLFWITNKKISKANNENRYWTEIELMRYGDENPISHDRFKLEYVTFCDPFWVMSGIYSLNDQNKKLFYEGFELINMHEVDSVKGIEGKYILTTCQNRFIIIYFVTSENVNTLKIMKAVCFSNYYCQPHENNVLFEGLPYTQNWQVVNYKDLYIITEQGTYKLFLDSSKKELLKNAHFDYRTKIYPFAEENVIFFYYQHHLFVKDELDSDNLSEIALPTSNDIVQLDYFNKNLIIIDTEGEIYHCEID